MMLGRRLGGKNRARSLDRAFEPGAGRATGGQREDVGRDARRPGQRQVAAEGVGRVFGGRGRLITRVGGDLLDELDLDIAGLESGVLEHVADQRQVRPVDLRNERLAFQVGQRGKVLGHEPVRAGGGGELQHDDRLQIRIDVFERLGDERDHVRRAAQERRFARDVVLHLLVEIVDDLQPHRTPQRAGQRRVGIRFQTAVGADRHAVRRPGDERDLQCALRADGPLAGRLEERGRAVRFCGLDVMHPCGRLREGGTRASNHAKRRRNKKSEVDGDLRAPLIASCSNAA